MAAQPGSADPRAATYLWVVVGGHQPLFSGGNLVSKYTEIKNFVCTIIRMLVIHEFEKSGGSEEEKLDLYRPLSE